MRSRWTALLPASSLVCGAVAVAACGSSTSERPSLTQPSTPPAATPPTTTANAWSLSGRIVTSTTGVGVPGARLRNDFGVSTLSEDEGRFTIGSESALPWTGQRFTIFAAAFVEREVYLNVSPGARHDVVVDMIPEQPPFSLHFYRELVRNGMEQSTAMLPLRRWTTNPSFYVQTVDRDGRSIEPEVLELVLSTIPRAVTEWTSGKLRVEALETGVEPRPSRPDWVRVEFIRDRSADRCGSATVGAGSGLVTLVLDRCACGSVKIGGDVIVHEVGHVLGFWHVSDRRAVMYPGALPTCPAGAVSELERLHAAIAYRRPPGNLDPDRDPSSAVTAALLAEEPLSVSCFIGGRR